MKRKIQIIRYFLSGILAAMMIAACTERPRDAQKAATPPPIFPDYAEVTIPAEIAPLNFSVGDPDSGIAKAYAEVMGEDGSKLESTGSYIKFDEKDWRKLLSNNRGKALTVKVYAKKGATWIEYEPFKIHVSPYPLEEWGLTYRRIAPGYETYSKMGLYQRNLSNFDEFPIIENTMTDGQCYNCHTANRTDPGEFTFHVRGNHGATMISKAGECTWLKAANDSLGGSMVYPYWHPEGRYCAFSTNRTRQGFHIGGEKRLEVFDLASDVIVYDTETNEILRDSLLCAKDRSENTPAFSPDGKWLYFTTCLQKEYPLQLKDEQYDLCRVAFDAPTGRFGAQVDTLFSATAMGKSVTWPRPSYDGRYILFTLSDYGYFSIWHKESDQWLLDLQSGNARPLDEINSPEADSFHNWSADSRWIVFTSRRLDGLYSHLYITSVGDDGRMTKPFLLPQENPAEYYERSLYSFNTPDFTQTKVEFDTEAAVESILGDERVPTKMKK